jgi:hypothetical protein
MVDRFQCYARLLGGCALALLLAASAVEAAATSQSAMPFITASGKAPIIFVDGKSGQDITPGIQEALDKARANHGGTVILPPGDYVVSGTIHFGGSPQRFPKGGPEGIILQGGPTRLHYSGPDNSTVLDMPAPNDCAVRDISIDADNRPGVVGIHYRGGYDLDTNGGKGNLFQNLEMTSMDVGVWIGDAFGPDLVSSVFQNIKLNYLRIGVLAEGANVTGMSFYNAMISAYNDAAVKIVGHTARRIRESAKDPLTAEEQKDTQKRMINIVTGKEIFLSDVPPYALKHRTIQAKVDGKVVYSAGGGAPDMTFYNLVAACAAPASWVIDTNFGTVRVYTARIEGSNGIFRHSSNIGTSRFSDLLVDVNATSPGGLNGNVIEYLAPGPLHLIGGNFEGNIALGDNTVVYNMGVRFVHRRDVFPGMVRQNLVLPRDGRVRRIGHTVTFYGRRGTYDRVEIKTPENPKFIQLPGTHGAKVFGMVQTEVK